MHGIAGFFRNIIKPPPEYGTSPPKQGDSQIATENIGVNDKGGNPTQSPDTAVTDPTTQQSLNEDLRTMRETVYDLIKDIQDPEKPNSLEELDVVSEDNVFVQRFNADDFLVKIVFVPTVPHCSLASLIGLCMRRKLTQSLPEKHKLDIYIKEGAHETADEINKQINDKERIAAAMENPNLRDLVNRCIAEDGYG